VEDVEDLMVLQNPWWRDKEEIYNGVIRMRSIMMRRSKPFFQRKTP